VNPQGTDSFSQRRNVFGREDELKVAPKGVDKDHKDIDILKLRSFAVSVRFVNDFRSLEWRFLIITDSRTRRFWLRISRKS
jgi:hypothetical protein